MATCTITGTIHHPQSDTAWAAGLMRFVLENVFLSGTTVYEVDTFSVVLDTNGAFSIAVPIPSATGVSARYRCLLPDGSSFVFRLTSADTGPKTLSSLLG